MPTLFEALVKSIIQQQIPQRLALKITSKIVKAFGLSKTISGKPFYDFPPPSRLARAVFEDLRRIGLSTRKAEYISSLSKRVLEGYDLEKLVIEDPETAVSRLLELKGVGPWTAKLSIMAATGRLNFSLLEDRSVARGLERLGFTIEELSMVENKLRDYTGLVMYLASIHHQL